MSQIVVLISALALNFFCSFAFDPTPLQDFCVADPSKPGGCKDPKTVTADDFFFSGLNLPSNTSNPYRAGLKVTRMPGLNTLGIAMARLDFLPDGFIPPHYHPRATEILAVLEGSMEVGFITSYPNYNNIGKVLQKGDVFVVPVGLLHYQRGVGAANTVVLSAVNSQNSGIVEIATGILGAKPPVNTDYLAGAFMLDSKTVADLQTKFSAGR